MSLTFSAEIKEEIKEEIEYHKNEIKRTKQQIHDFEKWTATKPVSPSLGRFSNLVTTLCNFIQREFGKAAARTFYDLLCSQEDISVHLECNRFVVTPKEYEKAYNKRTGFRQQNTEDGHWFPKRKQFKNMLKTVQYVQNDMYEHHKRLRKLTNLRWYLSRNVDELHYLQKNTAKVIENRVKEEQEQKNLREKREQIQKKLREEGQQEQRKRREQRQKLIAALPSVEDSDWKLLIRNGPSNITESSANCLARLFLAGFDHNCSGSYCDVELPFTTRTYAAHSFVKALTGKFIFQLTPYDARIVRTTAKAFRLAWEPQVCNRYKLITKLDEFDIETCMRGIKKLSRGRSGNGNWLDGLLLRLVGTMSNQKQDFNSFSEKCQKMLRNTLTEEEIKELY